MRWQLHARGGRRLSRGPRSILVTISCRTLSCTQGSDQIRQAFSKRKKGLVLKSYQLFRLTDAKVRRPRRCSTNHVLVVHARGA